MSFILGGYTIGSEGRRQQLEIIVDPDELVIRELLLSISKGAAVIKIQSTHASQFHPYELALYAESGEFLLMLSEYNAEGDHSVRTLVSSGAKEEIVTVSILGEKYPVTAVTRDIKLVVAVFTEFALTGNVSKELMA